MRRFAEVGLLGLVLAVVTANTARAQSSPQDQARFEQALDLFDGGDIQGALAIHRQLDAEARGRPAWNFAASHANAAFQLGAFAEAADRFRYALAALPATEEDYEEYRAKISGRLAEVVAKVGTLTLVVQPAGAEILLDGTSVGRAPLSEPVYVMPGNREVQALLAGHEATSQQLMVTAGSTPTVSLVLKSTQPVPVVQVPNPSSLENDTDNNGLSNGELGLVVGGIVLGVGGVVAGIVLGTQSSAAGSDANELRQELDAEFPGGGACGEGTTAGERCAQLSDDNTSEVDLRAGAIGAGVAGGLLLIGAISYYLAVDDDQEPNVGVFVSPGQFGLTLSGDF